MNQKTVRMWQTVLLMAVDLVILSVLKLKQLGFI